MNTALGSYPEARQDPGPVALSSEPAARDRGNSTGDAWGLAGRAVSRVATVSRSCPGRHRPAASGPVLRTVATWSEYGPTLAEKRRALAAMIERRDKGNRSHRLLNRIYSARTEIIAMEIALA